MINEMNPLRNGEKTVLKIKVIDKDKAFDFIGKHLLNKVDFNDYGFSIEKMYLDEDRYKSSLDEELRKEIITDVVKYGDEMINSIISKLK